MPGFIKLKARSGRPARPLPGDMNGLEKRYAEHLEIRKRAGEIADWRFEEIKLKLAKLCSLTPDFFVLLTDGTIEAHEVKGHWEDDARVKIKVASEKHWWFTFVAVTAKRRKDGGGWSFERFE